MPAKTVKKTAKTAKTTTKIKPVVGSLVKAKAKAKKEIKKPKKLAAHGSSGVLGFCYRSPAVVKFMLPTTKFQLVNVGERGEIVDRYQITGGRSIVFMHKSVVGFRACVNRAVEAHDTKTIANAYHIVFDTYDQLARYTGIAIMDLQSQGQADWQVQRTYPEQLMRRFQETKGISDDLIAALADHVNAADPEDLIHTDAKVRDAERQAKVRSMLHVIQDLQSKNADKRNAIQKLICGFVAGQFVDENHVTVTKPLRVCRDAERCVAEATLISTKTDKEAFARSLSMLAEQFKLIDLPLRRPALEKIANLINNSEYVGLMRALLLVQRYNMAPDQASARTGANVCAVSLIRREVFSPTAAMTAKEIDENRHAFGAVTLVKRAQAQDAKHEVVFRNPTLRVWNKFKKRIEISETAAVAPPAEHIPKPLRGDADVVIAKHDSRMRDSVLDTSAVDSDSTVTEADADAVTDSYAGIHSDSKTAARAMRKAKKTMRKTLKSGDGSEVKGKKTTKTTKTTKITKPKKSVRDRTEKAPKTAREVKNPSPKKTIPAGTYTLTDIVIACRLADAGASPMAILSMSRTAVTFSAPRYLVTLKPKRAGEKPAKETVYRLGAGEKHKLRWRGALYRVRIAEAESNNLDAE